MRGALALHDLGALIAQGTQVEATEKTLARSEQDGALYEMQFIDEGGTQELPDRCHAAS
jgi:hypothetical protein